MKVTKVLLSIITISVCLASNAQTNRYSAFRVKGNVQVKAFDAWKTLQAQTPLSAFDSLKIAKNASLQILEPRTKQIYKGNTVGTTTVRQFVKSAKAQAEQSLSNLNRAFAERMKSSGNQSNSMSSMGAAYRGDKNKESLEDSICSSIVYIANQICQGTFEQNDTTLHIVKQGDKQSFVLTLINKSDKPYCVNVVCLDKDKRNCHLLLSPGYDNNEPFIILDANTRAALENQELLNDDNIVYFLIATEKPFDNEDVKEQLEDWQLEDGNNLLPEMKFVKL